MFGLSDIFIILLGFGAFELGFFLGMKTERENKNEQKKINPIDVDADRD